MRSGLFLATMLAASSLAAAETPLTIDQLLAQGWEIAGNASGYDNRTSLILFRHPGVNALVQCGVLYDVTRVPRRGRMSNTIRHREDRAQEALPTERPPARRLSYAAFARSACCDMVECVVSTEGCCCGAWICRVYQQALRSCGRGIAQCCSP